MTGDSIGPRLALPEDFEGVCDTLAQAFAEGPVAEWVEPDPVARVALYHAYTRASYAQALRGGEVWTTNDYEAAAVWFSVGLEQQAVAWDEADLADLEEPTGRAMAELATPANEAAMGRIAELDHAIASRHPNKPHHHLAFLGVHPQVQGYGIGSAMLKHHHARTDGEGRPSFLVATSDRSRALYAGQGYDLVEVFTIGAGPALFSMWREPHGKPLRPRAY